MWVPSRLFWETNLVRLIKTICLVGLQRSSHELDNRGSRHKRSRSRDRDSKNSVDRRKSGDRKSESEKDKASDKDKSATNETDREKQEGEEKKKEEDTKDVECLLYHEFADYQDSPLLGMLLSLVIKN